MLTGEIRSQIDSIWNDFWSGGVSNPLSVIEQITYLLFIKRLDELHTVEEKKASQLKIPMERRIFPKGKDDKGRSYEDFRWSRFKSFEPREMFKVVDEHVFPFLRTMGGEGSAFSEHMKDARLGIPTPALLTKAVEKLDAVKMDDRDTKGDVYEYMLGKIARAGQNGQFRTPRHIIAVMVALTKPTPTDIICDPAAGTCGFLVAAAEYLRHHHPELMRDTKLRKHFHQTMFNGFDFDGTMLRIGAMNMMLHGIEHAHVVYRDSLAEEHNADAGRYSLILANPPFAGSLDFEATAKDLQQIVKTKKTELLFLALFLRLLKVGGRAAVIVPDGVLFGSSKAHTDLRRMLVEDHKLDAVIKLPSGVFRPYAGVSTAILVFTKTGVGGTDHVWFYDMEADGFSLDDKRTPLLPSEKLGVTLGDVLSDDEHAKNNLPDVLKRWGEREDNERRRRRTAQSFCVPKMEIAAAGYDFSFNRYKEAAIEEKTPTASKAILKELHGLEKSISTGLDVLEEIFIDQSSRREVFDMMLLRGLVKEIQIGPFGSVLHKEDYVENGIPLVNPTHIVDGVIRISNKCSVSREKYDSLTRYHLQENDVVLGRRGDMGRCAVVTAKEHGYLCGTGSLFIRPNIKKIRPHYLQLLLSSARMVKYLENASSGVTMSNLNKRVIEELMIPVPSIKDQLKFEERLSTLVTLSEWHVRAIKNLQQLSQALQQSVFRGALVKDHASNELEAAGR